MSALRLVAVLLALSAFASTLFMFKTFALSEDVAASAIEEAEGVMASSYRAVLEAEGAGANVSGLLARMNEAGELLAQAQVSYRLGDFDGAARSADLCGEIGEGVMVEALGLRDLAVLEAGQRFRWTMMGSMLGVVIVVGASFLGWRIFKLRYCRRVLGMKPEVAKDES